MALNLDAEMQAKVDALRASQPRLQEYQKLETEAERIEFAKSIPLSLLIDMAFEQREIMRGLEAMKKQADTLFKEMEYSIILAMEAQSTEEAPLLRVGGLRASVSVVEEEAQNMDGDRWPELYEWILENEMCHILQKRLSSAAVRELLDTGHELPGVSTFKRKKLNMRAV